MRIVDTHCHVSPVWYEPVEVLLWQMDRAGVEQAVIVQYMGQYDNEYLFECTERHADRLCCVVLVDTARLDATKHLKRLAERGARGVRLGPKARSPGNDPFAIWREAEALGLVVSCSGNTAEFADAGFLGVLREVPRLSIVLEHLGSINRPDGELPPYALRQAVFALARYPTVHLKFHGLAEFAARMPVLSGRTVLQQPLPPLLDMAWQSFGPGRLMWGSDFPPVCSREGYVNALAWPMEHLRCRGEDGLALAFGGTARALYHLA